MHLQIHDILKGFLKFRYIGLTLFYNLLLVVARTTLLQKSVADQMSKFYPLPSVLRNKTLGAGITCDNKRILN